jgi:hypothetical protein
MAKISGFLCVSETTIFDTRFALALNSCLGCYNYWLCEGAIDPFSRLTSVMRNPESSNAMLVLVTGRTRKTASARLWSRAEAHLVPVSI